MLGSWMIGILSKLHVAASNPYAWSVSVGSTGDEGQLSMTVVNGKIWLCDNATVKAYNISDGSLATTINLNTYLGVSNNVSDITAIDANGVLWLSSRSSYHTQQPAIIRIDTTTGTIKDGLFGGTYRLTNDFQNVCGEGTTNYVWAVHENRDSGTVRQLCKIDIVSGSILNECTLPKVYDALVYDHVNKHLWGSANNVAASNYYIDFFTLDPTTYAPTLTTTFSSWGDLNVAEIIRPTGGDELVIVSQNGNNNQYHLARYSATTSALILESDLTDPRIDPNVAYSAYVNGPVKYNPVTDEIYVTVSRQAISTDPYVYELLAFHRSNLTFSRIITGDAVDTVWDYAISGGKTFVLFDTSHKLVEMVTG